jgi:hypothetical protein
LNSASLAHRSASPDAPPIRPSSRRFQDSDAPARVSSAPALRASYDGMQAKYKAALKVGAPIPPLTQGAK